MKNSNVLLVIGSFLLVSTSAVLELTYEHIVRAELATQSVVTMLFITAYVISGLFLAAYHEDHSTR